MRSGNGTSLVIPAAHSSWQGLRGLLALVSSVVFVETLFFTAITPLLPHYVSTLHLTKSGAGILVAAYPFGTLLFALPGGAFASRAGVKTAVVAGLVLMSAATLVFGFGRTEVVVDVARFAQGVGGSLIWAGALGWLAAAAPPDRRAAALGVSFGAAVSGALFGPALGAIASRLGTGPTFAAATVAGACLVVASLAVPARGGKETPVAGQVLLALREVRFGAGLWLTFMAGLAFGTVDVLAPLRLSRLGAGAFVIGATFLAAAGVEAASAPVIGRVADHRGRRLPLTLSVAAGIAVSAVLPLAAPATVLVVVLVAGLPAYGSMYVPAAALVSDGAQRRQLHQGLAFGFSNLAWAGGQAAAAAGSGALAQAAGDTLPYAILGAGFAATLVALSPPGRRLVSRLMVRAGTCPGALTARRRVTGAR